MDKWMDGSTSTSRKHDAAGRISYPKRMTSESLSVMYVCSGILRSFTKVCRGKNHFKKQTLQSQIITTSHVLFIHEVRDPRVTGSLTLALRTPRYRKVICNWPYAHGKLIHRHINALMRLSCYAMFVAALTGSLNVQVEAGEGGGRGRRCSSRPADQSERVLNSSILGPHEVLQSRLTVSKDTRTRLMRMKILSDADGASGAEGKRGASLALGYRSALINLAAVAEAKRNIGWEQ